MAFSVICLVRFLRAADEREIRPGGDALVPVGIQADAEQRGLAFDFFGVRHDGKVRPASGRVKNGTEFSLPATAGVFKFHPQESVAK